MQHQVDVVAHLADGQHLRVKTVHRVGDDADVRASVRVVPVDRLAAVTACGDVVDRVGELDAQGTGHGGSLGEMGDLTPTLPTLPLRRMNRQRSCRDTDFGHIDLLLE